MPDQHVVPVPLGQRIDERVVQPVRTVVHPARRTVGPQDIDAVALRGDIHVAAAVLEKRPDRTALAAEYPPVVGLVELDVVLVQLQNALPVGPGPQDLLASAEQRQDIDARKLRHIGKPPRHGVVEPRARGSEREHQPPVGQFGRGAHAVLRGRRSLRQRGDPARPAVVGENRRIRRRRIDRPGAFEQRLDAPVGEQLLRLPHLRIARRREGVAHPHQPAADRMQQQRIRRGRIDAAYFRGVEMRDVERRQTLRPGVVTGDPPPRSGTEDLPVRRGRDREDPLPGRTALFVSRIEAVDAVAARVDAVDAVVGGHPDDTRRLFDDVADHVVRDRVRIVGFELVGAEPRSRCKRSARPTCRTT